MTLTFLGTGTSGGVPILGCHCRVCDSTDPLDKRTRPSVLVEFEGRAVVIDMTPDFRFQALRAGMKRLDAIVFTHGHADHVLGLDDARGFYFRQGDAIPLYAEQRTMDRLREVFRYIFDHNYPYGGILKVAPHLIEGPFDLWGQYWLPVPVLHGRLPVLGFRIGKMAYVTDFSTIPESSVAMLEGLDVLILDALRHKPHPAHSTVEQSLCWVERLKPQRAFFTHIDHELAHGETNALLPKHVRLAHDGLRLEI